MAWSWFGNSARKYARLLTCCILHFWKKPGYPKPFVGTHKGLSQRSGLEISLDISEDFGRLSHEMELVIFRIVQESLTNIHRHSGSKSAMIRIDRDNERVLLEVQDKGKGMPAEKLSEIQSQGSGVGIGGMRERVRQFEGDLSIQSSASGTIISFAFLLPKIAKKVAEITPAGSARWMTASA